ncbi:SGNH/GDSL hydrolase family protein [Novosphingobium sp. 1949]|uniref:SGNH/GDSL hydrolase family protein n=1 Tax=Novosphingobium organovorum TaxID=2930092 RepID=A0ABT0BD85_9SPHN|nr:SGNH/GDSL hydrolase family protein [Novosphingobium organovorum]MCJ2183027.1 SGNH/GDSL hydrolase family protein [Novosphingobium organovorum]
MIRTSRVARLVAAAFVLGGSMTVGGLAAARTQAGTPTAVQLPGETTPIEAAPPPEPISLQGERYVAMGSSFAAGPLLRPAKPGGAARCGRSMNNYPTLLAERFGMILTDRSCSGATTNNVLGPWKELIPQIDAVTPQTRLVTITIGGNDLSYVGNLFAATCHYRNATAPAGERPRACHPVRVPQNVDYARVELQMNEIIRRIRTIAPRARIVLVQYLNPLPPPGQLCEATPISPQNAAIVRTIGKRLAEITDKVARERGVLVVEMNIASETHSPCDAEPWMIGSPAGYDGSLGLQWHLNLAGMRATARDIAWWLVNSGYEEINPPHYEDEAGKTEKGEKTEKAEKAEKAGQVPVS